MKAAYACLRRFRRQHLHEMTVKISRCVNVQVPARPDLLRTADRLSAREVHQADLLTELRCGLPMAAESYTEGARRRGAILRFEHNLLSKRPIPDSGEIFPPRLCPPAIVR